MTDSWKDGGELEELWPKMEFHQGDEDFSFLKNYIPLHLLLIKEEKQINNKINK